MSMILETKNLTMRFGGLVAVSEFSASIPQGSITGLIGPNGAGKTTCFNMVTGFYRPTEGQVFFEGKELTGMQPHQVCRAGIARTFQNIRLFGNETALENVMIGNFVRQRTGWIQSVLMTPASLREERELRTRSMELLEVVGLGDIAGEKANSLPYGAQRRLEIARALATGPRFLLLDEPAAGMNPQETQELDELIVRIRAEEKVAILLIEHDMKLVMNISDRIYVMEYGKEIAQGTPREIKENPRVIEAYLGEDAHA